MILTARYVEKDPAHIPFIEINSFSPRSQSIGMPDPMEDISAFPMYISLEGIIGDDRRTEAVLFAQKLCEEHATGLSLEDIKEDVQRRIEDLKLAEEHEKDQELRKEGRITGDTWVGGFPPPRQ